MLGSKVRFIPGIVVLTIGATLQAGATGAVKTVKMSAKLAAAPDRPQPLAPAVFGTRPAQTEAGGEGPARIVDFD
jgi:hypothetical protein